MANISYERATGYLGNSFNPTSDEFVFSIPDAPFIDQTKFKVLTDDIDFSPFSFNSEQFKFSANSMDYVTEIEYDSVSLQILENLSHETLKTFITWRDLVYDSELGVVNPPDSYKFTGRLDRINVHGSDEILVTSKMQSMYPENINPVTYEYGDDPDPIFYEIDLAVESVRHEF